MRRARTAVLLLGLVVASLVGAAPPARTPIAIVVNATNRAPDPSLAELRAMFSLERQFWPDGHRIVVFLPPPDSPPRHVLLERIYGMTDFELRKYWVGSLFRGAIPSIPSTLPTAEAVLAAVQESEGALSAVVAGSLPSSVRVLRIDGRTPDDPAYPLVVERAP
jgi:hypothetical protein